MSRTPYALAWILVALASSACSSPTSASDELPAGSHWCDPQHSQSCPAGQVCVASGGCWVPGDYDHAPGACDPTACQGWASYAQSLRREDAGAANCATLCSALCLDTCSASTELQTEDVSDMVQQGCAPSACTY